MIYQFDSEAGRRRVVSRKTSARGTGTGVLTAAPPRRGTVGPGRLRVYFKRLSTSESLTGRGRLALRLNLKFAKLPPSESFKLLPRLLDQYYVATLTDSPTAFKLAS